MALAKSQKSLKNWTAQKWRTKSGKPSTQGKKATGERYLPSAAIKSLSASEDPPRWHRVFWAVAIAILPIGLMYAGGIKEAQTATLVVSLPLTFTFWLSGWCLLKALHVDNPSD